MAVQQSEVRSWNCDFRWRNSDLLQTATGKHKGQIKTAGSPLGQRKGRNSSQPPDFNRWADKKEHPWKSRKNLRSTRSGFTRDPLWDSRHTARRSGPYYDQSARRMLGTAKGTRRISSQCVFRLQAVSGYGTGNTASWTPIHWLRRGEHPIRGYRSWFCSAYQLPYQSQNKRKGLSCIMRMQSCIRIIPGSTTKPSDQWLPKKF